MSGTPTLHVLRDCTLSGRAFRALHLTPCTVSADRMSHHGQHQRRWLVLGPLIDPRPTRVLASRRADHGPAGQPGRHVPAVQHHQGGGAARHQAGGGRGLPDLPQHHRSRQLPRLVQGVLSCFPTRVVPCVAISSEDGNTARQARNVARQAQHWQQLARAVCANFNACAAHIFTIWFCHAQTDMGGDMATRSAEDGAKAIVWAYLSPKVRAADCCSDVCRLASMRRCSAQIMRTSARLIAVFPLRPCLAYKQSGAP